MRLKYLLTFLIPLIFPHGPPSPVVPVATNPFKDPRVRLGPISRFTPREIAQSGIEAQTARIAELRQLRQTGHRKYQISQCELIIREYRKRLDKLDNPTNPDKPDEPHPDYTPKIRHNPYYRKP